MYFDAVFYITSRVLVFNGSPEETKAYLKSQSAVSREKLFVIPGETLRQMSVGDYLKD